MASSHPGSARWLARIVRSVADAPSTVVRYKVFLASKDGAESMGARWDSVKSRVGKWRDQCRASATDEVLPRLKAVGREIAPTRPLFFLVCFVGLTATFYQCSEPAQPWIELLNGATWPSAASRPASAPSSPAAVTQVQAKTAPAVASGEASQVAAGKADQIYYMQAEPLEKLGFNLVLALRTMVNLSGVVGVLTAIYAYRRWKESMMFLVKVDEIFKVRDLSISRGVRDAFLNGDEKRKLEADPEGKYFEDLVTRLGKRFDKEELPALLDNTGVNSLREFKIRVG